VLGVLTLDYLGVLLTAEPACDQLSHLGLVWLSRYHLLREGLHERVHHLFRTWVGIQDLLQLNDAFQCSVLLVVIRDERVNGLELLGDLFVS
jgi:hypothetical protein